MNEPRRQSIRNELPHYRHNRQHYSEEQKSLIEGEDKLREAARHDAGGKLVEADFVFLLDRHFHTAFLARAGPEC